MTSKQRQILDTALNLFSEEGYQATSTSKIAKEAGVSEGLIFRHFKNKKGLLEAILDEGEPRVGILFLPILNEEDPKQVIKKTLEMPFNIEESELGFWKLQFKLKWEFEYDSNKKMKPLEQVLTKAFTKLRYKKPELETQYILQFIDGISTAILKGNLKNQNEFKEFILNKYHIE